MNQTNNNVSQAPPIPFRGYSTPVQGNVGRFADHTFVYGMTVPPSEFSCHGRRRAIPAVPPVVIVQGNLHQVLAMVNSNVVVRIPPIYNIPYLDVCNIRYGFEGVCHQIANCILFTAGNQAFNPVIHGVRGLALSTMIYGIFGRTIPPFINRLVWAVNQAALAGHGSMQNSCSEYNDEKYREEILNGVMDSEELSSSFKIMILDELYQVSTMSGRVCTIISQSLNCLPDSDAMEQILVSAENLDSFMINIASQNKNIDNELLDTINSEIQRFDKTLYDQLGSRNYKQVFKYEYDSAFQLCEPLDGLGQ